MAQYRSPSERPSQDLNLLAQKPVLLTFRLYCQGRGPLPVPLHLFLASHCEGHTFLGRAPHAQSTYWV